MIAQLRIDFREQCDFWLVHGDLFNAKLLINPFI